MKTYIVAILLNSIVVLPALACSDDELAIAYKEGFQRAYPKAMKPWIEDAVGKNTVKKNEYTAGEKEKKFSYIDLYEAYELGSTAAIQRWVELVAQAYKRGHKHGLNGVDITKGDLK